MGKVIKLDHITKIEGHASLTVKVENGEVKRCDLSSVEGSRYFEGIVKGRHYDEAPEMISRICGVCSCAHTLAACFAMEDALGIRVSDQTIVLRKLLNWAERIRSHATHLYFLSLPDFLGYSSALDMVSQYREEIKRALQLMKLGNRMVTIIGGRDLHPVSAQIGGFLKVPRQDQFRDMEKMLREAIPLVEETIALFARLEYPRFEREVSCFSVFDPKEYGMFRGVIKTHAKEYDPDHYRAYIREYQESDTTANFVVKEGRSYRVGALARMNNAAHLLHPRAKKRSREFPFPNHNPFVNNFCQAIELMHAIEECLQLLEGVTVREERKRKPQRTAGRGIAAIEVPRGTLWHEYVVRNEKIASCNIITPTAQNLRTMEEDIRAFLPSVLEKKKPEIVTDIEKLIRSYDPCFSCSTHFLDVTWL